MLVTDRYPPPLPHRLRGPQRVFDLQQNMGGVNVSIGCTPPQLIQTSRAMPQKVGYSRRCVGRAGTAGRLPTKTLEPALWSDLRPRSPAAVANPARTLPAHHPGSKGLFRMHTSLEGLSPVTCSLWVSPHPAEIGKFGQAGLGWDWRCCAVQADTMFGFQAPPLDACPPT